MLEKKYRGNTPAKGQFPNPKKQDGSPKTKFAAKGGSIKKSKKSKGKK